MPRHTVTPEERAERRRRYMREYQRNRRQSLQVETSETETQQRNSMSQAEYMREYRRNRLRTAEMEVIATVEAENINTSRAEYMREYQRRRQQITEIEVVETVEAENISNSRAEYMQEYRRRCRLTAEIEVVQAEVVRAQVIQAEVVGTEVVGTEVVETEAAETEEENHNSRAEYMREYMREYRRRRRLTAEIEVVRAEAVEAEVVGTEVVETEAAETEEENHNSRAEYMREYRRSRQSRAIEENERVVRRRRLNDVGTNNWSSIQRKYESTIREGPTCVCGCCGGLFFQKDISSVKRTALTGNWGCSQDIVEKTFWAIDNHKIPSTFVGEDIIDNIPLCPTCKTSLKKKTLPTLALSNGLHFPDHVVCLDDLTRL
ncbi:hypothetical protein J3Q64DRAFT_1780517, partial [Phycomyces blakesleeanus]